MIQVKNVNKSFGDKVVLKDVSFDFYPGKTNLIIGASGSGKTTLCKCIVGLHTIDQGEIWYNDEEFASMNFKDRKKVRQEIGFLFQGSALFDSQTVAENVMFPLDMFTEMTRKEKLARAKFCLERVGLTNVEKLFPSELSGGMKKRVGIARAISMQPKYLFCDEPNSGLDPQTSILIDNLIHSITEEYNITTIVVTHDMNSVMEIGDNIIFIHKGEKWWTGDKSIIADTDNPEVIDFVYASHFMKQFRKME